MTSRRNRATVRNRVSSRIIISITDPFREADLFAKFSARDIIHTNEGIK
jgi:hypothetical protein